LKYQNLGLTDVILPILNGLEKKKKIKFQWLGFYLAEDVWHAPIFFPTQVAAEHSISGAHFGSQP
jgi:hypothetical protein